MDSFSDCRHNVSGFMGELFPARFLYFASLRSGNRIVQSRLTKTTRENPSGRFYFVVEEATKPLQAAPRLFEPFPWSIRCASGDPEPSRSFP